MPKPRPQPYTSNLEPAAILYNARELLFIHLLKPRQDLCKIIKLSILLFKALQRPLETLVLVHEAFVVARPTLLTKTWLGLWFSGLRGYRALET